MALPQTRSRFKKLNPGERVPSSPLAAASLAMESLRLVVAEDS